VHCWQGSADVSETRRGLGVLESDWGVTRHPECSNSGNANVTLFSLPCSLRIQLAKILGLNECSRRSASSYVLLWCCACGYMSCGGMRCTGNVMVKVRGCSGSGRGGVPFVRLSSGRKSRVCNLMRTPRAKRENETTTRTSPYRRRNCSESNHRPIVHE
jgi:hypothetical protein